MARRVRHRLIECPESFVVKSAAASVRSATYLKTAKMWITIPHGYLPGDDFPVYDASDTYLGTRGPAGYYKDQLEFYRSMLHKKRSTKKSAYGKTAAKQLRGAGDAACRRIYRCLYCPDLEARRLVAHAQTQDAED